MAAAAARAAAASQGPRAHLHSLTEAYRAWAVAEPASLLADPGRPGVRAMSHGRHAGPGPAVLGPFLPVFAGGSAGAEVAGVVDQMTSWAGSDAAVAGSVAEYVPAAAATPGCRGRLWPAPCSPGRSSHGSVGLEAAGQFAGMGRRRRHAAGRADRDAGERVRAGVRPGPVAGGQVPARDDQAQLRTKARAQAAAHADPGIRHSRTLSRESAPVARPHRRLARSTKAGRRCPGPSLVSRARTPPPADLGCASPPRGTRGARASRRSPARPADRRR